MRLTLSLADFSGTGKNIGTLNSWFISKNTPSGLTWTTAPNSVDKGADFNAVAEIDTANYELVTMTVTMGTTTQTGVGTSGGITISNSGSQYTIYISSVTANVNISVTTKNLSTGLPDSGGSDGGSNSATPIIVTGVDVAGKMPQADGYKDSTSGHVMEYSGYNWADYDVYVSCRFGTTTAMYAACVWGTNDTYLGGIWQSTGTATIFTEELLTAADLPSGVTWADVEKIGLSWSSGKNTPQLKLVPKV